MAAYADRMKSLTDDIRTSTSMRNEAIAQIRSEAEDLLARARSFMGHVSETRKARQETVSQLLLSFKHARNVLAVELGEASLVWREFTSERDQPVAPSVPAPTKKPRPSSTHVDSHTERAAALEQDEPLASFDSAQAKRLERTPTKGGKHRAQAHHGA